MIRRLLGLLAAGALLSSCGSQSASSALSSWVALSNFHDSVSVLTSDARHAVNVLKNSSATSNQLHTVCAVLLVDAESANASLPSPDDQATLLLSRAYDKLGAGANECYVAASSTPTRTRALRALEAAGALLSEATARVGAIDSPG